MLLAIVVGAVILVGIVILVSPNAEAFKRRSKIPPVPLTNGTNTASIAVMSGGLIKAKAVLAAGAAKPVAVRLLTAVRKFCKIAVTFWDKIAPIPSFKGALSIEFPLSVVGDVKVPPPIFWIPFSKFNCVVTCVKLILASGLLPRIVATPATKVSPALTIALISAI